MPKEDAIDAIPARAAALSHDADEATKAAAAAKAAVMPAKRAAAMAPLTVRRLSDLKRRADAALTVAEKKLAGVNAIQSNPNYVITDQARADAVKAAAEDARQKAAAEAEALGAQLDAAKTDAKAKQDAAAAAVAAAKDAEAKRVAAVNAATAAKLAERAGRDLHQPRDAEALCAARHAQEMAGRRRAVRLQPGIPGRHQGSRQAARHPHLHRGGARGGSDGLGGLRWTEVSIDNGDSAKNALDRITFPQAVLDNIAPTAVPLSSIIISDEPLSSETNYRTEFVAVLSNQPQGGFITRMPSPSTT